MTSGRLPAGNPWPYLLHEEKAGYDLWPMAVLVLALAATLVPAVVLLFYEVAGAIFLFGTTAFDALLFHLVLPRRYQVFHTRLRIVLGWPLHWDIPLSTIREARPARPVNTWIYDGIRFATSSKTTVEITREKGLDVIVSPRDRQRFLERLGEALRAARES